MEAKSTDKKTFQLTEDGRLIGSLNYENLFFVKAEIDIHGSETYSVKPVGFFGTSIAVTRQGTPVANLSLSWGGQIVIAFQGGPEFALKLDGFFSNRYVMQNGDKETLIQLESRFNWREFQYRYDIAYDITRGYDAKDPLLLMLGVYSANFFIATLSGANAGIIG